MKGTAIVRLATVVLFAVVAVAQCRLAGRLLFFTSNCSVSCINISCDDSSLDCIACFTACPDGSGSVSGCGF